jgi:hypothetical protein
MPMAVFILFSFMLMAASCTAPANKGAGNTTSVQKPEKVTPEKNVRTYSYRNVTIPEFFEELTENHSGDFYLKDSLKHQSFIKGLGIDPDNELNRKSYFTLFILHKLFTSETAANKSQGEILDIPYMWHWVKPNPRHTIRFTSNGNLLNETPAPDEFSRYNSYADIDRTPYLFLSDLVSETPKYYFADRDTFCTFGWCSEREMAFVALTSIMGYEGKVIVSGNHSWSEFIVPFISPAGGTIKTRIVVDNTFDNFNYGTITQEAVTRWRAETNDTRTGRWYNSEAHSGRELQRISEHTVPAEASLRIEKKVVEYLRK